jgi:hypothetical protein
VTNEDSASEKEIADTLVLPIGVLATGFNMEGTDGVKRHFIGIRFTLLDDNTQKQSMSPIYSIGLDDVGEFIVNLITAQQIAISERVSGN